MRCPNCAGEIPAGSRFCGICGRSITPAVEGRSQATDQGRWSASQPVGPTAASQVDSVSLFEMPASRAGQRARMALVLVLDAILAGAGVVMMLSYLESRRDARRAPPTASREAERGKVEVLSPTKVTAPLPVSPPSGAAESPASEAPAPVEPAPEPTPVSKPKARPAPKPKPKSRSGSRSEPGVVLQPVGGETADLEPGSELSAEPDAEAQPAEDPPAESEPGGDDGEIERVTARLRRVVDSHQGQLEQCYVGVANSGGPDGPLEGRIDIRFTLMTDGRAANVSPTGNTTGSAALADCVADLIRSWRFTSGLADPLELEWPFLFRPPVETAEQ